MVELKAEIEAARREVEQWQSLFDAAIDEPTVDYTDARLRAAQIKLDALYARAKQLMAVTA